jgi:hypothetical protein
MAKVWTTDLKIEEGLRLKEEGNAFVKAGEFKKALKSYKYVFLYVNGLICMFSSHVFSSQKLTSPRPPSTGQ